MGLDRFIHTPYSPQKKPPAQRDANPGPDPGAVWPRSGTDVSLSREGSTNQYQRPISAKERAQFQEPHSAILWVQLI